MLGVETYRYARATTELTNNSAPQIMPNFLETLFFMPFPRTDFLHSKAAISAIMQPNFINIA